MKRPLSRSHLDAVKGVRAFTLAEIIAVIGIMVLLMSIALPGLEKLALGSNVGTATRMITAELRLARQEALVSRKCIALLLPGNNASSLSAVQLARLPDLWYKSFRLCVVKKSGSDWLFDSWFPGTKWEFLPMGTIVARIDDTVPASPRVDMTIALDKASLPLVKNVPLETATTMDCRAVIFKRNGTSPSGLQQDVWIVEGNYDTTGSPAPYKLRNARNYMNIVIDQYTGKVGQVL